MTTLIRREGVVLPGGYSFKDPRTGMFFEGMAITFKEQVNKIINHRRSNPNVYPAIETKYLYPPTVADELDAYTCNRLGNNPKFCVNNDPRLPSVAPEPRKCPKCDSPMEPTYCKTCGGHKIKGYKCTRCGTQTGK